MLRPAARARGYATEAGRAALAWGFERLGLSPIRSEKLLGEDVIVHVISREEWVDS